MTELYLISKNIIKNIFKENIWKYISIKLTEVFNMGLVKQANVNVSLVLYWLRKYSESPAGGQSENTKTLTRQELVNISSLKGKKMISFLENMILGERVIWMGKWNGTGKCWNVLLMVISWT